MNTQLALSSNFVVNKRIFQGRQTLGVGVEKKIACLEIYQDFLVQL